jgi:hypothetical protein
MVDSGPVHRAIKPRAQRASRLFRTSLAYLVVALCLVWVFYDIEGAKLLRSITRINLALSYQLPGKPRQSLSLSLSSHRDHRKIKTGQAKARKTTEVGRNRVHPHI